MCVAERPGPNLRETESVGAASGHTERRLFALVMAAVSIAAGMMTGSSVDGEEIEFNRDIRPLLSDNCFHCHGPDDATRAAGLRLDRSEEATEYAIVPGDAEASELVRRITSDDPDLRMPPPESERALSGEEIARIERWVSAGAAYESHWAFVPPRRVVPPRAEPYGDATSPIDRFIDRELRDRGLARSPRADRATLIRRATFDLTGLPPTLGEIDDFLNDRSPNGYERLLDRLLQSEHFGERMASDWLDVARYSDTYGLQVDRDRFVWPWRDWVIRAFNAGMPYDRFLTQQIAGDLIPGATRDQILATTFNRLHPQEAEGGSVPEEFRSEYVADRTQTFATGILGLTMECCRCHHHKYDPISQDEYYALSAFFDNVDEAGLYSFFTPSVPTPTLDLPTERQERERVVATESLREAETRWRERFDARQAEAIAWAEGVTSVAEVEFAEPLLALDFESEPKGAVRSVAGVVGNGVELTGDDGIGTEAGNFRRSDPFSVALWIKTPDVKERAVVFHRSRAWTDAGSRGYQLLIEEGRLSWSLIHFWPGNAVRVRAVESLPVDRWVHVTVSSDGSGRASGLTIDIDGEPAELETVRDSLTRQITGGGGDTITIGERFRDRGFTGGQVDEFYLFGAELSRLEIAWLAGGGSPSRWAAEGSAAWASSPREHRVDHYRTRLDPVLGDARDALREARRRVNELNDSITEIMVMREMPEPRPTYRLRRGDYTQPAERVEAGTPSVLPPLPEGMPADRLALARWVSDPDHPLTARVAVNRLWQLCFGHGLVRTPEDFGTQGSPPTHPELLDWLAGDFVSHGWDIKRMLKRIMMSSTYRRSSRPVAASVRERDPENLWLARFPSSRLPAEMLRDGALASGGRLVRRVGGPPVRPYELEASFKPSERDEGAGLYRRSLYTYWKRTGPAPALLTLDAAKRDVCQVKRERTSSPLQALVLFNGPQYVEASRGLAERLVRRHGGDRDAILRDAYRTLTGRHATSDELSVIASMLGEQVDYFVRHRERAESYLGVGEASPGVEIDAAELAGLTAVVQALFNFDRSVMKR